MLAMDVNDNAYCLNKRVALAFIASKLAPTGIRVVVEGGSGLEMAQTALHPRDADYL